MTEGTFELGATGEFPKGKLQEDDEGELALAVGVDNDRVMLEFGKSVKWIGLTPDDARRIADLLRLKADSLALGGQVPFYRSVMCEMAGWFEARADEEHQNAMDSKDITQVAIYAGREQIWREAIREIHATLGLEDRDAPPEERDDRYVDEFSDRQYGFGFPGEHEPEAVDQEAKKDVD